MEHKNEFKLVKRVRTETAHRLFPYTGNCKAIHGHSYVFDVEITGTTDQAMLLDFKDLKLALTEVIVERLDHKFVVSKNDPNLVDFQKICENVVVWETMPTAESFAKVLAEDLLAFFPSVLVDMVVVTVWETADSCAVYAAQRKEDAYVKN